MPFDIPKHFSKGDKSMPHTIAVAGKGGVGKTTTCGMIIDYLCRKRRGPVLVVDADANSNQYSDAYPNQYAYPDTSSGSGHYDDRGHFITYAH